MGASNDKTSISLEELKAVASSLQTQKETINNLYKNNIVSILESTRSCFKVAGVNYSSIEQSFKSTYTELNNRYEELINVLNNNVIAGYAELSATIVRLFNSQFAKKFNELMGVSYLVKDK